MHTMTTVEEILAEGRTRYDIARLEALIDTDPNFLLWLQRQNEEFLKGSADEIIAMYELETGLPSTEQISDYLGSFDDAREVIFHGLGACTSIDEALIPELWENIAAKLTGLNGEELDMFNQDMADLIADDDVDRNLRVFLADKLGFDLPA